MLAAMTRLWVLPVAVATAFLITLPFAKNESFSDGALIALEIAVATATAVIVFTAVLLPGAAVHTWLMRVLESRRASLVIRWTVALVLSPLIGAWLLVFDRSGHEPSAWLFYFGSTALFAGASVWYGSRRDGQNESTTEAAAIR